MIVYIKPGAMSGGQRGDIVIEQVEKGIAKGLKLLAAVVAIVVIVKVFDEGQADDDALLQMTVGQELQVVLHEGRRTACVAVVDVGIHVLHIYIIMMYVRDDGLELLGRHVERRLEIDAPLLRTELTELYDEMAME